MILANHLLGDDGFIIIVILLHGLLHRTVESWALFRALHWSQGRPGLPCGNFWQRQLPTCHLLVSRLNSVTTLVHSH